MIVSGVIGTDRMAGQDIILIQEAYRCATPQSMKARARGLRGFEFMCEDFSGDSVGVPWEATPKACLRCRFKSQCVRNVDRPLRDLSRLYRLM